MENINILNFIGLVTLLFTFIQLFHKVLLKFLLLFFQLKNRI